MILMSKITQSLRLLVLKTKTFVVTVVSMKKTFNAASRLEDFHGLLIKEQ